ncbi:MAG: chromosome segregation protein SMC [Myxococcota bacterium]
MRIGSLEIAGFKSFADRVVLTFPPGLCAIVGPNGCGKSNVVDAIRWVMGEQNPRNLRGRAMEDLIFNGTDSRPPVGMAEVTLTLDNSDGRAPAVYQGFSEIQVSRRLYRSGESEYSINRVPCRLRDVIDFFMDTGVGNRGYTIVEQGRVAEIVSTRPQDRRFIIEEAAGIGKYRLRRRETERKLEATEQNLMRVGDILGELRRQISMLERQSRKAHRHRELSGRLREFDLSVAVDEFRRQDVVHGEAREELESLRSRGRELDSALAEAETRVSELRDERLRLEAEVQRRSERFHEIRAEIQGLEGRIEYGRREREELLSLSTRRDEEIGELERQAEQYRTDEVAAHRERSEVDTRLEHTERGTAGEREHLERLAEALAALQGQREALGRRLIDLSAESASLGSRVESLGERGRELERRLRTQEEMLEAGLVQMEEGQQEETSLERRLAELLAGREGIGRDLGELLGRRRADAGARERLERELDEVRGQCQHTAARLQSLEEAEREATEAVSEATERLQDADRQMVRGLLADFLEVRDGYERAVEAALGPRLQALLVGSAEEALTLLGRLRTLGAGRATLLAAASEDPGPEGGFVPLGRPLLEFVDAKHPYRSLVTHLLAEVYVVDELGQAVERYGMQSPPAFFVTRDGDSLDRRGTLTGGEVSAPGVISRSAEIRVAREELESLSERGAVLEADRSSALEAGQSLEANIENTRSRYHAAELAVLQHEKDLERARERKKVAFESVETARVEKAQVADERDRLENELMELRDRAGSVNRDRTGVEREAEGHSTEIQERSLSLERGERALVERQVELASLRERRDQLGAGHDRVRNALREAEEWIRRRKEEIREARERVEAFADGVSEATQRLSRTLEEEEELRSGQESARGAFEEAARALEELEAELRQGARERDGLRERSTAAELRVQEVRLASERTIERARERYGTDLRHYEVPSEHREVPLASRQAEAEELRRKLEALGPVHHGAIEEYEEISERFRYLSEQKADIDASIERLRNAIARINRTSRTKFRETFEAVDAEFRKTFPRLFRGGRAYLALTEGEDVLEAGIEIVAQPPGKKLQNLNLLSGGEKSMTALALLFAVFNVKPSPFFLLDEVDAALDDPNVARFDELMREMAPTSQFLLITHNKATIETSDTLYGVTMEEPGASKIVTVDLVS